METDSALLLAARKMDKEALVKVFDLYSGPLFNYIMRLCGDAVTADHIVGDVFAKLLEQLAAGGGPTSNLRSYLYETAYHRMIDETRYSKRRVSLETTEWLPQQADLTSLHLEERVMLQHVLHAIRSELTEDQRHVIVLRFLEDFSVKETAAIVGKKENHVKVIQNRAIAALRKALERGETKQAVLSPAMTNVPHVLSLAD